MLHPDQRRELYAKCAAEAAVVEVAGEWVVKWREPCTDIVGHTRLVRNKFTLGKSAGSGAITRADAESLARTKVISLLEEQSRPVDWKNFFQFAVARGPEVEMKS